ncbi:vWA domain-containing protein [Virgibacillus salexigens]|uniref:VWFA domain-containing protein n=1 Tax=Virgibacillus massiliensis TaxID=1462526 RepID=A0A024QGV4_9BACI|nr:vWA domain-containing protein [Virgibacillus massiliensis]CDQ41788.1 putative protein encoded in toxicity protection region of plasmid R478, contains von Willebrand factor (vWF) domain [Virgibacillus massiliensis]
MDQVNNESKLLYLQSRYQFEKAMEKFNSGQINTEPQLVQTVFQSFQDFFTQMGSPNLIPRYAYEDGPPWSEDYNEMMKEIKADLETLFQEVDILGRSLYSDFNHNVMQQDIINKEYEKVYDKLKDLEMYAGYGNNGMIRFGRDDFLNGFKIDYDRISGIPLEISTTGVSLPVKGDANNVAENAKITIVPGNQKHNDFILGSDSNGFPGNNNEVTMVSDDYLTGTSGYEFVGKNDNHGNYAAALDGDANTWFEYERINLRDHEKRKITQNLGWEYVVSGNKRLTFAEDPDDGVLRLHLQIVLEEEEIINQINLQMYTPPNYGSQAAIVKNILVSNDTMAPVSVLNKKKQDTDYSFRFDPIKAKVISVLFEQKHKYYTDIGHIFYEKKMNISNSNDYVFETIQHKDKAEYAPRIEGPLINLESLGIQIDVSETETTAFYPMKKSESKGYELEKITNDLMSIADDSTVDSGIERLEGWRYCIGIRDIEILSCEYEEKGELVTKPYYFDKPIERISVSANETIGDLLSENSLIKYNWITYFVSIDDGKQWHPITPIEHESLENNPPKLYTIQQVGLEEEAVEGHEGYIETTNQIFSLRLKIIIERPTDEEDNMTTMSNINYTASDIKTSYNSSTVQGFRFQVETKPTEEDIEAGVYEKEYIEGDYETLPPQKPKPPIIPDEEDDNEENEDNDLGIPPGGGYDPEDDYEPVTLLIENEPDTICLDKSIYISGVASSSNPITGIELWINGTFIDIATIESNEDISFHSLANVATSNQRIFNWVIPYSRIIELGLAIGDIVTFQIIAEDEKSRDTEMFSATIEECEEDETISCYELLSVIVHYYNEYHNEVQEIELAKDILPYEFDNGEGTLVTVGWNTEMSGPTVMISNGYHDGNRAFVLHSVGIRYLNKSNEQQVQWSSKITQQTDGVFNSHLMIGSPDDKPTEWINDIANGDYISAPTLNRINDWLTFSINSGWEENSCPIDLDYHPLLDIKPNDPIIDPDQEHIHECIEIRKIFIQYYNQVTKTFEIKQVELDRPNYLFKIGDINIEAIIGWYQEHHGVAIGVINETSESLYVSAIGILIRDRYDTVRTEWSTKIVIETNYTTNSSQLIGYKKAEHIVDWLQSDGLPNGFAPSLDSSKAAIVVEFSRDIMNQLCTVSNTIDDHENAPFFDIISPIINLNEVPNPFYYQDLIDNNLPLVGSVSDETALGNWVIRSLSTEFTEEATNREKELIIDHRLPIQVPDPVEYEEEISNKVDMIFVIDTSGSMEDNITNVKNNMDLFLSNLQNRGLDVHIGFIGSAFNEKQQRGNMTSADTFSIQDLVINGGGWENLAFRQITDEIYGAASLYDQLRDDAQKHIIMVTDTNITENITQGLKDDMLQRKIHVSVIWEKEIDSEPDYITLINDTEGISLDITNAAFHEELQDLADKIISIISYIPDSSQVIQIQANDEAGNITTQELTVHFTDLYNKGEV